MKAVMAGILGSLSLIVVLSISNIGAVRNAGRGLA
jgi:hypothetical protein